MGERGRGTLMASWLGEAEGTMRKWRVEVGDSGGGGGGRSGRGQDGGGSVGGGRRLLMMNVAEKLRWLSRSGGEGGGREGTTRFDLRLCTECNSLPSSAFPHNFRGFLSQGNRSI